MARYGRYDQDQRSPRPRDATPRRGGRRPGTDAMWRNPTWAGGYPNGYFGGGMMGGFPLLDPVAYPLGWGAPYGFGYPDLGWPAGPGGPPREPRRPPEQSPTYGRGGDRVLRRYLRDRGYDEGYTIQPHPPAPRERDRWDRGPYDRDFRRR